MAVFPVSGWSRSATLWYKTPGRRTGLHRSRSMSFADASFPPIDERTGRAVLELVHGCTFDDFIFAPQRSVLVRRDPSAINLSCKLSRRITLKRPIVSANMDTVTRAPMAIVQAEEGGIGIIDRGFRPGDIEPQVREVEIVKRTQHGIITDPYSIAPSATLAEGAALMARSRVGTLVVIDDKHQLLGLLTERDMRFVTRREAPVSGRMTPLDQLVIHRGGALSPEDAERIMLERKVKKLPLVDDAGVLIGLITSRDLVRQRTMPCATRDDRGRLRVGAAIGATGDYLERAAELIRASVDVIVIDIAHGHSVVMQRALEEFRKRFGDFELIAGNVATAEGTRFLVERGADAVKVGIGPLTPLFRSVGLHPPCGAVPAANKCPAVHDRASPTLPRAWRSDPRGSLESGVPWRRSAPSAYTPFQREPHDWRDCADSSLPSGGCVRERRRTCDREAPPKRSSWLLGFFGARVGSDESRAAARLTTERFLPATGCRDDLFSVLEEQMRSRKLTMPSANRRRRVRDGKRKRSVTSQLAGKTQPVRKAEPRIILLALVHRGNEASVGNAEFGEPFPPEFLKFLLAQGSMSGPSRRGSRHLPQHQPRFTFARRRRPTPLLARAVQRGALSPSLLPENRGGSEWP
jgi:IMP dehydrogenase/GMP reductase